MKNKIIELFDLIIPDWMKDQILIEILAFTFVCIFTFMFIFYGCGNKGTPSSVSQSGKDSFNVVFLFEKDGTQVYRFYDKGSYRYFIIGDGNFIEEKIERLK